MNSRVIIDFETYSDVDISTRGLYNYSVDPSTQVLCMGYKIDDQKSGLWVPHSTKTKPMIKEIVSIFQDIRPGTPINSAIVPPVAVLAPFKDPACRVYAHNAEFELEIIRQLCFTLWPRAFVPINSPTRFIDTMALCARNRLPLKLEKACEALDCEHKKNTDGTRLITKCCTPKGTPNAEDYAKLFSYCVDDIEATNSLIESLPADHLTPFEQKIWELTVEMNRTGVTIDMETVNAVVSYLADYIEVTKKALPDITNGEVTTPGQIQKILSFCKEQGINLPNLQSGTVDQALERDDLPENVKKILTIRKLLGRSSVKKYAALKNLEVNGVVKGNLVYHGAGTGRWAGRGFQYHNLPRAKFKTDEEVDAAVMRFRNREPMPDPVSDAKKLIRPMIITPPGKSLMVADYSSIENRILAWLAGDHAAIELFENNLSQYIDMAAYLYNVPYSEIKKGTTEYTMGKALILGCGYQMGPKRFRVVAKEAGIDIDLCQSTTCVNTYKAKYYLVVQLWKKYNTAVITAIRHPGYVVEQSKCTFVCVTDRNNRRWLRITLPSGRALMYLDPKIEKGPYGQQATYVGYSSTYHKMLRTALTPGLITENIDQAIARDILCHGKLNVKKEMPHVELCLTVQDELGCYIDDDRIDKDTLYQYCYHLCSLPDWAEGLPIGAEGYISKRYKKD